jgi:aryl-alcohol dehydrogenase-like predicted oxidoreductase
MAGGRPEALVRTGRGGDVAAVLQEYRRGGMLYRRLGRTEIFVSMLGFGAHTDPRFKRPAREGGSELNEEGQGRRDRMVSRALDLGVNLLDVYSYEAQYEPVAQMIAGRRDKVLVSLKHDVGSTTGRLPSDHLDSRARRFGGHVDLYRIARHDPIDGPFLETWDALRKAKQAGKIRATGIASHNTSVMLSALEQLDDLDFILFPYNFIHARADYGEFLPAAARKGVGLIAIKPLAAGSIVGLDPLAHAGAAPEQARLSVRGSSIHPEVVAKLTSALDRLPDETLCQAALRFVYSRPFMSATIPGMFQDYELEDNYNALGRNLEMSRAELGALDAAREAALAARGRWLPQHYRWLDEQWRA